MHERFPNDLAACLTLLGPLSTIEVAFLANFENGTHMTAPLQRRRFLQLGCGLGSLATLAGCGTADYEARVDEAVKRLKIAAKFTMLDPTPTLVAQLKGGKSGGASISFRKPAFSVAKALTEANADAALGDTAISPLRIKPSFLTTYPGYQYTLETANENRGLSIVYFYLGAQIAEPGVGERVTSEIAAALPNLAPLQWSPLPVDTDDGGKVTWSRLTFTAEVPLALRNRAQPEIYPTTFNLLLREQNGYQVVFGGLWTNAGELSQSAESNFLASAGTFVITPGAKT
jgi:hypothetical protein